MPRTHDSTIASTIHDMIDEVTTTVEHIHQSVADVPFNLLGGIEPLEEPIREVRALYARSMGAVYALIRRVNDEVRQLTTRALAR